MKRWFTRLAVFLLLGAIVNVAVAWGCAVWVDPTKGEDEIGFRSSGQHTWEFVRTVAPGTTLLWSTRGWRKEPLGIPDHGPAPEGFVPSWTDLGVATSEFIDIVDRSPDSLVLERRWLHCFGWPRRSLWSHWHRIDDPGEPAPVYTSGGYVLSLEPWMNFIPRALPARPIWSGFTINTIFYAALLWLLAFGPLAARRFIRHKRGRCIKCGYDLRGTSGGGGGCPECGWGREEKVEA